MIDETPPGLMHHERGEGALLLHPRLIWLLRILALDVPASVTLFGVAMLILMLAPERHRDGSERLQRDPLIGMILGLVVLVPLIAFAVRFVRHERAGALLLWALVAYAAGTGLSVCARVLGARVLPERSAVAQTALGMCALLLPTMLLVGIPVVAVAAPLGLGAWLLGRKG